MSATTGGRPFFKMSGSGNDFVVFDARTVPAGDFETPAVISRICERRTGIGADGVVFIERSTSKDADFVMRYLNRDGSPAAMCGNAALCVTWLAAELGAGAPGGMRFQSDDGLVSSRITAGLPEVDLAAVRELRPDVGLALQPGERRIGFALAGVPHLVVLCDDALVVDVEGRGAFLRRHPSFQGGANVNFVSRRRAGWLMRTFERGVEAETLACGTGSVAVAVLLATWEASTGAETDIETRSGRHLIVRLEHAGESWNPTLRGEGRLVFHGELPMGISAQ